MALAGAPIAAWDNVSQTVTVKIQNLYHLSLPEDLTQRQRWNSSDLSECKLDTPHFNFRLTRTSSSDTAGAAQLVAIYQASQDIYNLFDKAIVLYEGRQIYFGPADEAREYFEGMGWFCPPRQTTGDFLTSVTNPQERKPREGHGDKVPRTPEDFEAYWKKSSEYKSCVEEIEGASKQNTDGADTLDTFRQVNHRLQAKHTRPKSAYRISIPMQVRLCSRRAYQRLWNDKASTIAKVAGQLIQVSQPRISLICSGAVEEDLA